MDPDSVEGLRASGGNGAEDAIGPDGRVPHGGSDDPDLLDFSANTNPRVPPDAATTYREAFEAARSTGGRLPRVPGGRGVLRRLRTGTGDTHGRWPRSESPGDPTTVRAGDSVLVPYPSFGEYAREVRLQDVDAGVRPTQRPADRRPGRSCARHRLQPEQSDRRSGRPVGAPGLRRRLSLCWDDTAGRRSLLGCTDEQSLAGREGVIVARSLTSYSVSPASGWAMPSGPATPGTDSPPRDVPGR